MNKKLFVIFSIVVIFGLLAALSPALAEAQKGASFQPAGVKGKINIIAAPKLVVQEKNQGQEQEQEKNQGEETASTNQNQNQNQQTEENQGQVNAQSHRSAVANFVQELLQVADREGGIGEQVREIARQQNQAQEQVVQAIEKVEKRSKIKTFLIGNDYKNLGALRSEMVQVRNRIEQTTRLMEKAAGEESKAMLQEQIQNLEQEQTRIENFIKTNENKFSLFGWLVKLFQS
ncbi:hypothetical protein KJ853_00725 [Patescibacteria group bacterium]|nr:hypothetical protein [Patescibacteria group bacterium]